MTQPSPSQPYHQTPLRVGLFLDSLTLPYWAFDAIAKIVDSSIADTVLLIVNDSPKGRSRWYFLYDSYIQFDQKRFGQHPNAFESKDLRTLLSDCPVIRVVPESNDLTDTFSQVDVDKIQSYNLDVAVRFGFQIPQGKILEAVRYGIWSYRPMAPQNSQYHPAGFWEVMNQDTVMSQTLEMYSKEAPNGRIIYQSYGGILNYSVVRTLNRPFLRAATFTLRKLDELYKKGPSVLQNTLDDERVTNYKHSQIPGNLHMLALSPKIAWRYLQKRFRDTTSQDQWEVAYYLGDEQQSLEDTYTQHKFLKSPNGRFWADPFVIKKDNRFYIFIEEFINKLDRGILAVIEIDDKGNHRGAQPILEKDYHLSYPFIFEWENEYYMVPETHENGTIDLYRSKSWPDQWEYVKTMIDGVTAADATLFELNGKWWMFTTIGKESMDEELYIFYADSPMGEWKPHMQNPVKSDIRSARPAGRIFKRGETYYRPAQDCSVRYGYAIVIHEIIQLDTETYIEKAVNKILPHGHKGIVATHTVNHAEGISVVDGVIWAPK